MSQSLIPDIKPLAGQEAVVDLHADDSRISEDETERNGDDGTHDKGLKICRTVTQVRHFIACTPLLQEGGLGCKVGS